MLVPRRFFPSISSLLALEAVERLGSATAAAEELFLTHSAVSRQLKVLEEQLGVKMFIRQGKGLSLTPVGVEYARSMRDCLHDMARASLRIKASGSRSSLNLAVLPAFGMHWFSPRLRRFIDVNSGIIVNMSTRLLPFDFNREKFDAAIHYGKEDWPGVNYLALAGERVLPVCAPDFLTGAVVNPEDLLESPLLHLENRPGAWEEWFVAQGVQVDRLRGMLFDQFANMTEAAVLGFGVALLPEFLAEAEISKGRLVAAFARPLETGGCYYLVWPNTREPSRPLEQLVQWLKLEGDIKVPPSLMARDRFNVE